MELEMIVVGTRAVILVIAALAGVMCIYLGWRLIFEGIKAKTQLELSHASLKVSLSASTPGIFFVLFGIGLLIYSVQNRIDIQDIQGLSEVDLTRRLSSVQSLSSGSPAFGRISLAVASQTDPQLLAQAPVPSGGEGKGGANSGAQNKCPYRSRAIKWFDSPDTRAEPEVIVDALDTAAAVLAERINADPAGAASVRLQRAYLVVLHTKDGFK